jgi:hypothetical protein
VNANGWKFTFARTNRTICRDRGATSVADNRYERLAHTQRRRASRKLLKGLRDSRWIFARTNPMLVSIGARSRVLGRASPPRLVPGTRRARFGYLIDHARVCWLRAALLTSRTHPCLPSRPSAWRERIDLDAIACVDRVIKKSVAHVSSAWRKALTVAATPVNPQIALPVVSTNILTAVLA